MQFQNLLISTRLFYMGGMNFTNIVVKTFSLMYITKTIIVKTSFT